MHVAALSLVPVRAGASTGCCEKEEQGEGQGRRRGWLKERAGQRAVSWARGGEASGGGGGGGRLGVLLIPLGQRRKKHTHASLSQLCTKRFT